MISSISASGRSAFRRRNLQIPRRLIAMIENLCALPEHRHAALRAELEPSIAPRKQYPFRRFRSRARLTCKGSAGVAIAG